MVPDLSIGSANVMHGILKAFQWICAMAAQNTCQLLLVNN